jgi:ABC-type multidrug transport system fused ATPase/permease subunit
MLVAAAAGLVLPLCSRLLIDALTGHRAASLTSWSIAALGASFLILSIATYLRERMLGTVSQYVARDLRRQLYDRLARLSVPYVEATSSGELLSVMTNDIRLLQEAVAGGAMEVITQLVSAVAVASLLIGLDAPLTLGLCGLVPVALVASRWSGRRARAVTESVQADLGRLTSVVTETIRGLDVVKAFVLRRHAAHIFGEQNERATAGAVRAVRIRAEGGALVGLLGGLSLVMVVGVGSLHVSRGRITPGDLVAYIVYAQMILGPLGTLSGIWVDVQRAVAAGRRVFGVLDAETEPEALRVVGDPTLPAVSRKTRRGERRTASGAAISVRDLWFRYDPPAGGASRLSPAALQGIDLEIAAGESVALVGPSGAGKSTLLELLLRFYTPQRGQILLDGAPLQQIELEELRRDSALVMQETHLFDMSVRDNILCGNPEAGEVEATRAARRAHAHEFVARLPEGYATRIGEHGARLSGGQRQRIALARAFVRRPRLLLLDEATASLDTESERRVQAAMRRIMRGRTSIVIAHRLATVQHTDRIFVMDRGRIVSSGTHEDLLEKCPLYARLCRSQLLGDAASLRALRSRVAIGA